MLDSQSLMVCWTFVPWQLRNKTDYRKKINIFTQNICTVVDTIMDEHFLASYASNKGFQDITRCSSRVNNIAVFLIYGNKDT